MKLIKLSEQHYIVVDDSEIKEGDWYYDTNDKESLMPIYQRSQDPKFYSGCKKITHSTNIDWHEVYYIPLSEVKELLGVVDVEKKAKYYYGQNRFTREYEDGFMLGFKLAYNQALEDNKDRKYTREDLLDAFTWGFLEGTERGDVTDSVNKFSQALQPQTEWEVEFIDGKLKLKQ